MKTFIVLPTYNEVDNLKKIVCSILKFQPNFNILIVDDNSPDGTGEIADQLSSQFSAVSVIHRPEKSGLGTAYVTGFKKALSMSADLIFEMDADYSHDPNDLQFFLKSIQNADLVIGSRYVDGVRVLGWRFRRLLISKMANIFISHMMVNPKINDYTAGYRCYRREILEKIDLDKICSDGYAFQIEMTHRTFQKGFKIVEIPIIFKERERGTSKISRSVVSEAFRLTLKFHAPVSEIIKVLILNFKKYLFLDK